MYFAVLFEQRRSKAMLCAFVQRAADNVGLRAVSALGAELLAPAASTQHTPGLAAELHTSPSQ